MSFPNHDGMSLHDFPIPAPLFDQNDAPSVGFLPEALRIFRKVAGYDLRFVRPGSEEALADPSILSGHSAASDDVSPLERSESFLVGDPARRVYGALKLSRALDEYPRIEWDAARELAALLAGMLAENCLWRDELTKREGELAATSAGVEPSAPTRGVGARLRDALRSGANALGNFSAAALYLLDDQTSRLKTRAVWGLPDDRYLEPPRPLRGSRADIEALLGSAVTINDDYLAEAWKAPESFACSVCIPVASETTILGVAWFFSDARRELGAREMETLDLVARRLVDELEKEAARVNRQRQKDETTEQVDREIQSWGDSVLNAKK